MNILDPYEKVKRKGRIKTLFSLLLQTMHTCSSTTELDTMDLRLPNQEVFDV